MENPQSFFDLLDCRLDESSVETDWICCERGSDLEFYISGDENKPNLNLKKEAIRILRIFRVVETRAKFYLAEKKEFKKIDGSLMKFDYPNYPNHVSMWKVDWIELSQIEDMDQYEVYCSLHDGDFTQGKGFRDAFAYTRWSVLMQNDTPISYRMVLV
jgi:hypothetical protein